MTKFEFIKKFYDWKLYDDKKVLEFYEAKVINESEVESITGKTIIELRSQ